MQERMEFRKKTGLIYPREVQESSFHGGETRLLGVTSRESNVLEHATPTASERQQSRLV